MYKKKLIRLADQFRLVNQIKFIENCGNMPLAYKISDIVVSASIEPEAFGRVSVEAQSMEKPVVASNIGGSKETILNNKSGLLFESGKAEALASLAQAAFIAGSGVFLLLESVDRFVKPQEISNSDIGIVVMVISIVMTLLLVGFQTYVVNKTKSIAINADSLHYRADILVNIAVITSLVCSVNLGWTMADPIFALLIICYMSVGSYKIGAQALDVLMDREFPDEDRKRIKEIAESHESVLNVHDMRTRCSGATSFIQFHAEMPKDISLSEAHEIADEVMYMVEKVFPNTEVLIHQDPEGVDERRDVM